VSEVTVTRITRLVKAAAPAVALLCMLAPLAPGATAAPKVTSSKVGAWEVLCATEGQSSICKMRQNVAFAGTNKTVLNWLLGYGKDGALASTVYVPNGVRLDTGLDVKWPASGSQNFKYDSCTKKSGCSATVALPKELLSGKAGKKKVEFTFYDAAKKPYVYSLSLNGFDKAAAKIKP
jgi:invasion protein IalB